MRLQTIYFFSLLHRYYYSLVNILRLNCSLYLILVSTENFKVTKSHYIIIKDASLDDSTTYTCQVKPKTKAEVEGELALVITPRESPIYFLSVMTIKYV